MRKVINILIYVSPMFILFFLLNSCLRDFDLDIPLTEKKIAVTCFFSSDTNWEVDVYYTHHIDSVKNYGISNALVTIKTEEGQIINLKNAKGGKYISDTKPIENKRYFLTVLVNGFDTVFSESYIPSKSQIDNFVFDNNPGPVLHNNFIDDVYSKISFKISPKVSDPIFASVRILGFDPETGFNTYCFNNHLFELMEAENIPQIFINKLKVLKGKKFYSFNIDSCLNSTLVNASFYDKNDILSFLNTNAVCAKHTYRSPSLFKLRKCFSHKAIFYQAPYESATLLMHEKGSQNAEIYFTNLDNFKNTGDTVSDEEWVSYSDLSIDYYKYLKDYVLQISNRGDLNSPPVIIYSNIKNGVGIFAGYQQQLVRVR